MENTHDLLTLVLEQHYKQNPKKLQDALNLIKNYSDKEHTHENYEKILNSVHNTLKDLPQNILLYLLTTIPIPEESAVSDNSTTKLLDLMKETHTSLPNNIRPILLEYLNSNVSQSTSNTSPKPVLKLGKTEKAKATNESNGHILSNGLSVNVRKGKRLRNKSPVKVEKKANAKNEEYCKRLDDLCAEYIYSNMNYLNTVYKGKLSKIMQLKTCCRQKHQHVLKDTNRKIKLLRMIENGDVTHNFLKEEYDRKDMISAEKATKLLNSFDDSLNLSAQLKKIVNNFYDKL